ncbi:50S ribosomal protein L18e [Candidatus Woesearchaeota archaeon]|nr:50S ribosomal protein L18e [Candidatus Woesearchaeota archaeon]
MKKTGPSNESLKELIILMRKNKSKFWKRIRLELEKSNRRKKPVNIDKINMYTNEKEIAVVPTKVLSEGELTKKITISAFQFSKKAREKINKRGKAIDIKELLEKNPNGKGIRIIK